MISARYLKKKKRRLAGVLSLSSSNPVISNMLSRVEQAKAMKDEEKLYRYNGVLYPSIMCPENNLKALGIIKAREDDIMLVAYPKCGEYRHCLLT